MSARKELPQPNVFVLLHPKTRKPSFGGNRLAAKGCFWSKCNASACLYQNSSVLPPKWLRPLSNTLWLSTTRLYPAVVHIDHGLQATLACARFNGTPQAFLVEGDFSAELTRHQTASSASDALPLPNVQASRDDLLPPEGTFDRVDTGFRWLTGQNARLLAFFAPAGGLDYLSNPIALSMLAQRAEILAATRGNINQLIQGAEALLRGYQAFLLPAGNNNPQINKKDGMDLKYVREH